MTLVKLLSFGVVTDRKLFFLRVIEECKIESLCTPLGGFNQSAQPANRDLHSGLGLRNGIQQSLQTRTYGGIRRPRRDNPANLLFKYGLPSRQRFEGKVFDLGSCLDTQEPSVLRIIRRQPWRKRAHHVLKLGDPQ